MLKNVLLSLGRSVKFSDVENSGEAHALLQAVTVLSSLCKQEHGRGQTDFFQNCANHWWLPNLANICMSTLWRHLRASTGFLSDIFLACDAHFFLPSLFSCITGAVFTSPLCQTAHFFSHSRKELWFFSKLLSFLRPFPLSILHCFLRMECSISLQYFQYLHVRTASCSVRSLTDSWVVTYTSVQLIRNISDCMILSLSTSINWSNLLRLSYVCVMACDKQINHIADRFHLHSQVIPSSCANHVKKYIYICQQLGVFSIFPSLRIHSVCDKCVLMIGKWGLLNFCNCKPSVMVAYHMGRSEGLAWQQTSSGKRWFSKS